MPLAPPPQRRVVSSTRSIFANDYAGHAAVADDQVRPEAQRHHRRVAVEFAQEARQVVDVSRLEQPLGAAAALEPHQRRERSIGSELAPHS